MDTTTTRRTSILITIAALVLIAGIAIAELTIPGISAATRWLYEMVIAPVFTMLGSWFATLANVLFSL